MSSVKLKKITKLKNLGIFRDFSWPKGVPEFNQYNVIYGGNGTGKTTLSRLFDVLGADPSYTDFPSLQYKIQGSQGSSIDHNQIFSTPIYVFNQDYIGRNVNFITQTTEPLTIVLGKENKKAAEEIIEDEEILSQLNVDIGKKTETKVSQQKLRDEKFTNIAKLIKTSTSSVLNPNYNKATAEAAFAKLAGNEGILSDKELTMLQASVSQDVMHKVESVRLDDTVTSLNEIVKRSKKLLSLTVEAAVIDRLKDHQDISQWVEAGILVHKTHESDKCEFCGNPIAEARLEDLSKHFNQADADLKSNIDKLVEELGGVDKDLRELQPVGGSYLYKEYHNDYEKLLLQFNILKEELLVAIEKLTEHVKDKKTKTTEVVAMGKKPNVDNLSNINDLMVELITQHNNKTDNFKRQQDKDGKRIECHHLRSIYDEVKSLDDNIQLIEDKIKNLIKGKTDIEARVKENRTLVSSDHKACKELNLSLASFLGYKEITLSPGDNGYQMLRNDLPAENLSEGEKTAIAFVYFVTELSDATGSIENSIVLIDDPVSSLDSNSQFQAFSFLKSATKNAGQLFLLTHNFSFLKLVLSWIKYLPQKKSSMYMIKNIFSNGSRTAQLCELDPTLEKFENEYAYLFSVLYEYYNRKDDITIKDAYPMPNIARKVLENFLMFRVPTNESAYNRLKKLGFDEKKSDAIWKFVNNQSHITGDGIDTHVVRESINCIRDLLELIKETFPEHYEYLMNQQLKSNK